MHMILENRTCPQRVRPGRRQPRDCGPYRLPLRVVEPQGLVFQFWYGAIIEFAQRVALRLRTLQDVMYLYKNVQ